MSTYQGHHPDGSGLQRHSCSDSYPYVLVLRDSQRPGAKLDWGVIGGGIDEPIWFDSGRQWDSAVSLLKEYDAAKAADDALKAASPREFNELEFNDELFGGN